MSKLIKPITKSQKDVTESLLGKLKPIKQSLKQLPAISFPIAIAASQEDGEDLDTSGLYISPIAEQYVRLFASQQEVVKSFGIYGKDGQFYIGDSPIEINDDNITVKDKEYLGTPGLWELLIMKEPDKNIYTDGDKANYAEILEKTSAMKHGNNPASNKPKSSKGYKYKVIIKPIWEDLYGIVGKGLKPLLYRVLQMH